MRDYVTARAVGPTHSQALTHVRTVCIGPGVARSLEPQPALHSAGHGFLRMGGNNPHRVPAISRPADLDAWLRAGAGEARAVLGPYPQDVVVAYQVSTRADGRSVNSPKNYDERLIEPFRPGQ